MSADVAVQKKSTVYLDQWVPLQFKSRQIQLNQHEMNFNVNRMDGNIGARYENMIIIAIALGKSWKNTSNEFDALDNRELLEIFIFQNPHKFPFSTLQPYVWRPDSIIHDSYNESRWVFERDGEINMCNVKDNFLNMIDKSPTYLLNDIMFNYGINSRINKHINPLKSKEIAQIKLLSEVLPIDYIIDAPWRQGETVDIIIRKGLEWSRNISLKSATNNNGSLSFNKGKHPNDQFCHFVIVFLYDHVNENSDEVHILTCKEVYIDNNNIESFNWQNRNVYPVYNIHTNNFLLKLENI
jgi:hypothetical protein